jgi:hypothetical protein
VVVLGAGSRVAGLVISPMNGFVAISVVSRRQRGTILQSEMQHWCRCRGDERGRRLVCQRVAAVKPSLFEHLETRTAQTLSLLGQVRWHCGSHRFPLDVLGIGALLLSRQRHRHPTSVGLAIRGTSEFPGCEGARRKRLCRSE